MNYIQKNFKKWQGKVFSYPNKRHAIIYYSDHPKYGIEEQCVATINLPDEPLEKDEVIIKDYSENEGI